MVRSSHHTQWAGTYAFAAELSRRSYDAALTVGNTPLTDLLCISPNGQPFRVEMKSLASKTYILTGKRIFEMETRSDFFLVVALVPETGPNRYFILTHQQIKDARERMPKTKKTGEPYKEGFDGLEWPLVEPYENAWQSLPV
jgi:hypothetical protein